MSASSALFGAEDLVALIRDFEKHANDADLRERVIGLVPVARGLRELGKSLVPVDGRMSGLDRVEHYLCRYPLTVIDRDELLLISGISDWPRRVRQLRRERGWSIYSGLTFKELAADDTAAARELEDAIGVNPASLRSDQYVLTRTEKDREAAHRWKILDRIRKRKDIGPKKKLLLYLQENVGRPVPSEELRALTKGKGDWPRRSRELRTDEGWPVFTRLQGRPDLPLGTYILEEDRQAPAHDRRIKDQVRAAVLERDNYACTCCGWTRAQAQPEDPRRRLELHHLTAHVDKGANTADNLATLCNVDHDRVHAGELEWDGGAWRTVKE